MWWTKWPLASGISITGRSRTSRVRTPSFWRKRKQPQLRVWNWAMIRAELVRRLVLNSICDDFENVDQRILRDVAEAGAKRGLIVERWEVVQALAGLIEDGPA